MTACIESNQPWVVWAESNGSGQPQFARLSDFNGQYIRGAPEHKVVDPKYSELFSFLSTERDDALSIFRSTGSVHDFDWLSRMWRTAAAMVCYQRDDRRITNAEFCYMMGRSGLKVFEHRFAQVNRGVMRGDVPWHKEFKLLLLSNGWEKNLNKLKIAEAIMVSHGLMLHLLQQKVELLERQRGRINQPSIAEAYANKLAWRSPTLYAFYVHPLFRDGVYGRQTFALPIICDDSYTENEEE